VIPKHKSIDLAALAQFFQFIPDLLLLPVVSPAQFEELGNGSVTSGAGSEPDTCEIELMSLGDPVSKNEASTGVDEKAPNWFK
jgi:hypothetical protein